MQLQQQRDLEGSLGQTMEGPITKDEEEVVETLSALAAMFSFPIKEKNDFDCKLVNAKSSPLIEGDIPRPAFQGFQYMLLHSTVFSLYFLWTSGMLKYLFYQIPQLLKRQRTQIQIALQLLQRLRNLHYWKGQL